MSQGVTPGCNNSPFQGCVKGGTHPKKYNSFQKNRLGVLRFASEKINAYISRRLLSVNDDTKEILKQDNERDIKTIFHLAFDEAFEEFTRNNSFNGIHNPQILLITDGKISYSKETINAELTPIINRLIWKGCTIHIVQIGIPDKNKQLKDETVWQHYVYNSGGLYKLIAKPQNDVLNRVYENILYKMLDLYIIELRWPIDTYSPGDKIRINARLFKDKTKVIDPSIYFKTSLIKYPSNIVLTNEQPLNTEEYIWNTKEKSDGKSFDIQMIAFWENENNVLAKYNQTILISGKQDNYRSLYKQIAITITLLIIIGGIFIYISKRYWKNFQTIYRSKLKNKISQISSEGEYCFKHRDTDKGSEKYAEATEILVESAKDDQKFQSDTLSEILKKAYISIELYSNREELFIKSFINAKSIDDLFSIPLGFAKLLHWTIQDDRYSQNIFKDINMLISFFEESFKISKRCLDNLKEGGVPEHVISKLEKLKNKTYTNQEKFLHTLENILQTKHNHYESLIVKYASLGIDNPMLIATFRYVEDMLDQEQEEYKDVFRAYTDLFQVNDKTVEKTLKEAIKVFEPLRQRPLGYKIVDTCLSVYNSFKPVFSQNPPKPIYLSRIDQEFEKCQADTTNDPNIRIKEKVLTAIRDYIFKNTDPKLRQAEVNIIPLEKNMVFCSKEGTKKGYIIIPLLVVNNSLNPAEKVYIEVQMKKGQPFKQSSDNPHINKLYPALTMVDFEDPYDSGAGLIPLKLEMSNEQKVDTLKAKLFKHFHNYADGCEQPANPEEYIDIELLIKYYDCEVEIKENPYKQGYYISPYSQQTHLINFINEFIRQSSEKHDSANVLNLYGMPGVGKTSLLTHYKKIVDRNNFSIMIIDKKQGTRDYTLSINSDEPVQLNSDQFKDFKKLSDPIFSTSKPAIICIDDIGKIINNLYETDNEPEIFIRYLCEVLESRTSNRLILSEGRKVEEIRLPFTDKDWHNRIIERSKSKEIEFLTEKDYSDFFSDENAGVIRRCNSKYYPAFNERAKKAIQKETAGHPGLMQMLCYHMVELKKDWLYDRPLDFWDVDKACNTLLSKEENILSLKRIWNAFDLSEKFVLHILAEKLKTEDDISIQFAEKPSFLEIIDSLTWETQIKINNPVMPVSQLISKRIIKDKAGLYFQMNLLRRWICRHFKEIKEELKIV
ncbi:MAG: AAA family ATPase [Desulfobacteraceae bacterium]|nr:AAA family ATPase [Desulfobacteraceae bacterium]